MKFDAHKIAPGLWMGSKPHPGSMLRSHGIDIVVLCAMEHQPSAEWFPGVEVARIFLDDAELDGADAFAAMHLASQLAKEIKCGRTVLVTCRQGRNRSGLVTALTFAQLTGCSGLDAVEAVRRRRHAPSGPVLSNHHYTTALSTIPAMRRRGPNTERAARAARMAG